ncbi:uncharacterized protein N7496_005465 [Penicillium cataractarum]|uniref:DUF7779 domain-containing protein n=1 Tax=Penicillium cataractarum TaxID=2100454 RepID=A0A9W9VG27_9EURO|nr:uncharacterized protein N7496_005465 [Penicillium cataractarum]KAJ5378056.1 hypothetical protein N7496_005465 [Penicillium cataractarum]
MGSVVQGDGNSGVQVGINHGSICVSDSQALPEIRPDPLSTVPFSRDPDFVSRDGLISRMDEKASIAGSRLALVGLGGVGKTQLAIEYCYKVRERSPDTWILWIHASNAARYEKSLHDLADRLKIPRRHNLEINISQLVANWLQDENIGKWILVLDNVDDDELLRKPLPRVTGMDNHSSMQQQLYVPAQPPLRDLLQTSSGSIIVTSRNKGVALDIVGHKNLINVQPMNEVEAVDLLKTKLNVTSEPEVMESLVEALDFIPLAIVQAAAYITHRSPFCSVSQYLQAIQNSDHQAVLLLDQEADLLCRDWEAKNSVLITWQISFEYIRRVEPSAADLLSLMSFFDRQGIPRDLLLAHKYHNSKELDDSSTGVVDYTTSIDEKHHRLMDDITTLRDYSLVAVGSDHAFLTMHRLVQLTVRAWLNANKKLEEWKDQFIKSLYYQFPVVEYENWKRCQSLFPHVKWALFQRPLSLESLERWSWLLYQGAYYAMRIGNLADARKMAFTLREQEVKTGGPESDNALLCTELLAKVYRLEGRWNEAAQLQEGVIKTRNLRTGENHLFTLSKATLGLIYMDLGRWEEAEQLLKDAVEALDTQFGDEDPETLSNLGNLALVYWCQGRWDDAQRLQVQIVKVRQNTLGLDHLDTLMAMANLGATYISQGRFEEAKQILSKATAARRTKLGEEHPRTLESMANLAATYWEQDQWEEAERLQLHILRTNQKTTGRDHPNTLSSMASLALTYSKQSRWVDAEHLQLHVMQTMKIKLGEDHPQTLTSMANLAGTYMHLGRWDDAENIQMQEMRISTIKLGTDHPDTLVSMANLATTLLKQGRLEEASRLQLQVMQKGKVSLGDGHPDMVKYMGNMASIYKAQGCWGEAECLEVKVMQHRKVNLGQDHLDTVISMGNLATTYMNQGRWEEARQLLIPALRTRQTRLGQSDPRTLATMSNLATVYSNQGNLQETEKLEVQIVDIRKKTLGHDHHATLSSMLNLALTLFQLERYEEGERLEDHVIEVTMVKLGAGHPDAIASVVSLAFTCKATGRRSEAVDLLLVCVAKQERILGPAHPDTVKNSILLLEWEMEGLNLDG